MSQSSVQARANPSTPRSTTNDINAILATLNALGIPIETQGQPLSPSKLPNTKTQQCLTKIQFLYHRNRVELHQIINTFRDDARQQLLVGHPIDVLLELLTDASYLARVTPTKQPSITDRFRNVKRNTGEGDEHSAPDKLDSRKRPSHSSLRNGIKYRCAETIGPSLNVPQTTINPTKVSSFASDTSVSSTTDYDRSFHSDGFTFATHSFTSTLATSFGGNDADDECPGSTFGSDLTFSQMRELEALGDNSNVPDTVEKPSTRHTDSDQLQLKSGKADEKLEYHLLRKLPYEPFSDFHLPPRLDGLPFAVRWECFQLAVNHGIDFDLLSDELRQHDLGGYTDRCQQEDLVTVDAWLRKVAKHTGPGVDWMVANSSNATYGAKMIFKTEVKNSKSLLSMIPSSAKNELTCRLQRRFGATRFLYLECPEPSKSIRTALGFTSEQYRRRFVEWMETDKEFLSNTWQMLHVERIKRDKKKRTAGESQVSENNFRTVWFATSGKDLQPIALEAVINYAVPLAANMDQSFCRAFARLELSLSRTVPAVSFSRSQVRPCPTEIRMVCLKTRDTTIRP